MGSRAHLLESGQERIVLKTRGREGSISTPAAVEGEFVDPLCPFDEPEDDESDNEGEDGHGDRSRVGVTSHWSKEGKYFVEFAKSGRAECVRCGESIDNKTLRIGTNTKVRRKKVTTKVYTHLECFHIPRGTSSDKFLGGLTGFSELPAREQLLVRNTLGGRGKPGGKASQQSTISASSVSPAPARTAGKTIAQALQRRPSVSVVNEDEDFYRDEDDVCVVDDASSEGEHWVSSTKPAKPVKSSTTTSATATSKKAVVGGSGKKRPFAPPYRTNVTNLLDDSFEGEDDKSPRTASSHVISSSRLGVDDDYIEVVDSPPAPGRAADRRKTLVLPQSGDRSGSRSATRPGDRSADSKKRVSAGERGRPEDLRKKRTKVLDDDSDIIEDDDENNEEEVDDDDDESVMSAEVEEVIDASQDSEKGQEGTRRSILNKRQREQLNKWLDAFRRRWSKYVATYVTFLFIIFFNSISLPITFYRYWNYFSHASLYEMLHNTPVTSEQLAAIPGIGRVKVT